MKKLAQQRKPVDLMSLYVTFLRALYLLHQENHLKTPGYAEHLLFQRLYEGVQEAVDEAAEKTIGVFGDLTKMEKVSLLASQFDASKYGKGAMAHLKSSLAGEVALGKFTERVYETLKESGAITLGLDDMLMSQASGGEVRIYLLQQAIKNHE
jgi:DNA-binding ferritin-like protein